MQTLRLNLGQHPFVLTHEPRQATKTRRRNNVLIGRFSNFDAAVLSAVERGLYGFKVNQIPVSRDDMRAAVSRVILRNEPDIPQARLDKEVNMHLCEHAERLTAA